jgi:hypothetical protein
MKIVLAFISALVALSAAGQMSTKPGLGSNSSELPGPLLTESMLQRIHETMQNRTGLPFGQTNSSIVAPTLEINTLRSLGFDGAQVANARNKLAQFYKSVPITHSITLEGVRGSLFDCIPIKGQPALRLTLEASIESPPPDPDASKETETKPGAACRNGEIPFQRQTLLETAMGSGIKDRTFSPSFLKLRGFTPFVDRRSIADMEGRTQQPAPFAPGAHLYAHAMQRVTNEGASARLNVWSPAVPAGDMSLSQIWIVGGDGMLKPLQTVEAGWQVLSIWDPKRPTLFVYSTSDNYGSTGCYATKCNISDRAETFVITNPKVIIGKPLAKQSILDGEQVVTEIKWIRSSSTGSWWLKIDGEWVGYYPKAIFNDGPLSKAADFIDFGGETYGVTTTSQMGSGRFSNEGKNRAAFQSHIRYLDLNGNFVRASLKPYATTPTCYTASLNAPMPPEGPADTYLYFGGPGGCH